ncbi:pyrimidine reductase family protein [Microbacterium sp.]|uniref:pyrimidine reductase family protein n=1 Tax=Microbacterium sp. TaxID=51671 RepID=UPI003A92B989
MIERGELLRAYALDDRTSPRVRMNFVASADGAGTLGGRSGTLGGATDRALMEVLRAMTDAIVVGAGTVRTEGYGGVRPPADEVAWRRAGGLTDAPRLVVVSRSLRLTPGDPVFAEAASRPIVVTSGVADARLRAQIGEVADVLVCGEDAVDLAAMTAALAEEGMPQLLCEGGPHLFGSLLDAGLVDEVCLTLSPRVVGGRAGRITAGAAEADRRMELRSVLHDDEGFVFLRYARAR